MTDIFLFTDALDLNIAAAILDNLTFDILLSDTVQPVDIRHEIDEVNFNIGDENLELEHIVDVNAGEIDDPWNDDEISDDEAHSSESETDSSIDKEEDISLEIPSQEFVADTEQREVISSEEPTTVDRSNEEEAHSSEIVEARTGKSNKFIF